MLKLVLVFVCTAVIIYLMIKAAVDNFSLKMVSSALKLLGLTALTCSVLFLIVQLF